MGKTADGPAIQPGEVSIPNISNDDLAASAAYFGVTDAEVKAGDPEATPAEPDDQTPEDPPKSDDPAGKPESAKKDEGEKLYAGKYKSLDDLEKAALEKDKFIETLKSENKTFRAELDEIKAFKADFEATVGKQKTEMAQADKLKANLDILRQNDQFIAAFNKVAPSLTEEESEGLLQMFGTMLTEKQSQQSPEPDDGAKQLLATIRVERENEKFYSKFPEAKELEPDMITLFQRFANGQNDPQIAMELFYKAALGDKMEEISNRKAQEILKKMTKAEKDKLVAGSLTAGQDSRGGPAGSDSRTEQQRLLDTYWGQSS